MSEFKVFLCDVFAGLRQIESESVDCVVTSPPYWGLRDYKAEGQIGLERHPQQYIEHIVSIFEEIKRVLKPTGTIWLNLGDSYASHRSGADFEKNITTNKERLDSCILRNEFKKEIRSNWLQPKQRLLIPHRIAIAMQEKGWCLRNDLIWKKINYMPTSVKDRLSNSFEYIFFFVKNRKYYFDLDAIRIPHTCIGVTDMRPAGILRQKLYKGSAYNESDDPHLSQFQLKEKEIAEKLNFPRARTCREGYNAETHFYNKAGKNPGDFWQEPIDILETTSEPFPETHFAVFPTTLSRFCLKAGCPKQICIKCGKSRKRITKTEYVVTGGKSKSKINMADKFTFQMSNCMEKYRLGRAIAKHETLGFSDCGCGAGWRAGVVLDPFVGSGTTLQVAQELGLNGEGIELQPNYANLIMRRLNCKTKIARNKFSNPISTLEFISEKEILYEPKKMKIYDEKQARFYT